MGFQAVQQRYKKKASVLAPIAPYYGLSTLEIATESMILNLANRGTTPGEIATTFTLTASNGNFIYFAYPSSYGTAVFTDLDTNWPGGWDGGNNDPFNVYGPALLNVHVNGSVVPFYVYRTDWPDLGTTRWSVTKETGV